MTSVLFDFGGTLDADGSTWRDRFYAIYKESGVDVKREDFARAFYRCDDALPQKERLAGLSLQETLQRQVDGVLEELAPKRRSTLRDEIVGRFLSDCRSHFDRNRPLLRRLKRRFKLGIVSNFYGNLESVLASEGLRELFSVVADSGVVGALKPEAGIFLHALGRLDAKPSQSLMVGDSLPRDMRGAEGLGMPHVLLGAGSSPRCCADALSIRTLPELESVLA